MAGVSTSVEQDVRGALLNDVHERFVHEEFKGPFAKRTSAANDGEPTGSAGNVNVMVGDRNSFEYHIIGTQTILGPVKTSAGYNFAMDQDNNDGLEVTLGNEQPADTLISNVAGATRGTFVVGTDAPFYVALKATVATIAGCDEFIVGFRKAEAYQAAIETGYDETAHLNVRSGDIYISTILNGGSPTDTDTTDNWAAAETHTLMVVCDSDGTLSGDGTVGKCYYMIDGLKPTTEPTSRFKFDSGEIVIPFFAFRQDAALSGAMNVKLWESGLWPMGETSQYQLGTP